jgi:hypothetical protein
MSGRRILIIGVNIENISFFFSYDFSQEFGVWYMPGLLSPPPPYGTHATLYIELHAHTINGRACLICNDTKKRDRGEMKKKEENAVGSQNGPHERGTERLQH